MFIKKDFSNFLRLFFRNIISIKFRRFFAFFVKPFFLFSRKFDKFFVIIIENEIFNIIKLYQKLLSIDIIKNRLKKSKLLSIK